MRKWTKDSAEVLNDCFESTDWSIFNDQSLDLTTDVISAYISFCEEVVLETKSCKVFPNTKPWVTPGLKRILHKKRDAFLRGDKDEVKVAQKQLQKQIREDKRTFTSE